MIIDAHVHIAELGRDPTTDRFLDRQPNRYIRSFLRRLRLPRHLLRHPEANQLIREQFLTWIRQSRVNRFVLLAMDRAHRPDGSADPAAASFVAENDFVADLAQSNEKLLFGASIHPYRPDALAELERLINRGACLVKWIPSTHRIQLQDSRCSPFYDLLAARGVPLLVHTGAEHVSSRGPNAWNHPDLLRHPLRRGVTVIAAHCGARLFLHEPCQFSAFTRLTKEFENLYGDISAFGIPTRIPILRRLLRDTHLLSRIVYGSDFPAFVMPRSFVFSIGIEGVRQVLRELNPFDRPLLLMQRMGLPPEVFSRAGQILRLPTLVRSVV